MLRAPLVYSTLIAFTTLTAATASAATITFTDSIALQSTNWTSFANLSTFDPTLGTLTRVSWTLDGTLVSDISIENLGSDTPAMVTVDGELQLTTPGFSPLALAFPPIVYAPDLGAFDGSIDFAGTSGAMSGPMTVTASTTGTSTDPGVLAQYVMVGGDLSLPFSAIASSSANGGGNLLTRVRSSAAATASITYEYVPTNQTTTSTPTTTGTPTTTSTPTTTGAIPEPASLLLVGGAMTLALRRLRRS